jgi:hypothetical protein
MVSIISQFKDIPEDLIENILEYDGRWRKDHIKNKTVWISKFHMSDQRYWMLDDLITITWSIYNKTSYSIYGEYDYSYAYCIEYVSPMLDFYEESGKIKKCKLELSYMHIFKIIIYEDIIQLICNCNIISSFTSKYGGFNYFYARNDNIDQYEYYYNSNDYDDDDLIYKYKNKYIN